MIFPIDISQDLVSEDRIVQEDGGKLRYGLTLEELDSGKRKTTVCVGCQVLAVEGHERLDVLFRRLTVSASQHPKDVQVMVVDVESDHRLRSASMRWLSVALCTSSAAISGMLS